MEEEEVTGKYNVKRR